MVPIVRQLCMRDCYHDDYYVWENDCYHDDIVSEQLCMSSWPCYHGNNFWTIMYESETLLPWQQFLNHYVWVVDLIIMEIFSHTLCMSDCPCCHGNSCDFTSFQLQGYVLIAYNFGPYCQKWTNLLTFRTWSLDFRLKT